MGWSGPYTQLPATIRNAGWLLQNEYHDFSRDGVEVKCLERSLKFGKEWSLWQQTSPGGVENFIVCTLWHFSGSGYRRCFMTKPIDLSMGPCENDCPVGMMEKLTDSGLKPAARRWEFRGVLEPSWLERWAARAPGSKRRQAVLARGLALAAKLEEVA